VKWKLWHGQTDRAIDRLEKIITALAVQTDASAKRLLDLAQPLLTYIRSNRGGIVDYGARYRSGRRIASSLAESAVDSPRRPTDGQETADAMVALWRAPYVASAGSSPQRRLERPLGLAASKADAPISLGVDVRADPTIAESRVTPS
jgi:hypothetical protein